MFVFRLGVEVLMLFWFPQIKNRPTSTNFLLWLISANYQIHMEWLHLYTRKVIIGLRLELMIEKA